ncbi:four-carbon acid sugar kinase family protein [Pectinatus brassicae]|uniref:Uncharacterized protein YgbK (DUF1537 family) n=1 Tax=Pectinatus brassicae TaxID=862415 RepID=A0A840US31_9FIRM|nr:four-carbon acid sugar kinase family protein [Pectinatus brassicae]MBB5336952.1 uncharacterized protein YgbK (DUF1537 family) [Pectinatus brassicae]
MSRLAVIADDLTGANDTAVQFAKKNMSSYVKLNIDKLEDNDSDVLIIDSDSRDLSAEQAYKKVKNISEKIYKQNISCVYKKIDSTLRGNIGAEIKAVADVFLPEIVIVAPAYPSNGRITVGGYHLLDGMLLEYTEIAHAPKTPVDKSYIPCIIRQQVDRKIGVLELKTINKGLAEVRTQIKKFIKQETNWIVCDAAKESDLQLVTEAIKEYQNILWVGSAGLAGYLNDFYNWIGTAHIDIAERSGSVLIVAGSISHITQRQIKYLMANKNIKTIKVDIAQIFIDKKQEEIKLVQLMNKYMSCKMDVLLTAATDDTDVAKAAWLGKQYDVSLKEVSEKTACFIAEITAKLNLEQLAGMVLTGGDTAVHICRAINADAIQIINEIDTGVPLGILYGENIEPIFVVTKAGAFGKGDIFVQAIDAIRNGGHKQKAQVERMIK